MDELIQIVGSLLGLVALVGVLVLFSLWWSTRRDRGQLHRHLRLRDQELGVWELLAQGDASRQIVQSPEEPVPEPLEGDGSPQAEEPREEEEYKLPEAVQ